MMDFNIEEEILISLREMATSNTEEFIENRHSTVRHSACCQAYRNPSSSWLDLRVFYIRMSKYVINDDSAPEYLRLNHIPLNPDVLLKANGMRAGTYSNDLSTLLKRVRLDTQSEEVAFACADGIRTTGSLKFEVFNEDVLVLSGTLEPSQGKERNNDPIWSMNCELNVNGGNHNPYMSFESGVEVFVAGCFLGCPIVLTRTLQLGRKRKQTRKGVLEPIPEWEATESLITSQLKHYTDYKPEEENGCSPYQGLEGEEEDGDLSWFNAGVRIGIGIGLSICLGVGLLVRAYRGTARNFTQCLV